MTGQECALSMVRSFAEIVPDIVREGVAELQGMEPEQTLLCIDEIGYNEVGKSVRT